MTEFRHELKHEIGAPELLALRQRLSAVLTPDRHSDSGRYTVRSLYFDDARDSALREKLDGVGALLSGASWEPSGPLAEELHARMSAGLRPRTLVDYTREAFTFPAGNVRVTLDYDIRTGLDCTAMLDTGCVTVTVPGEPAILEVKWDEFLPDIVRDAVALRGVRAGAFSKDAACRAYG